MKRSLKFRKMATRAAMKSVAWFFTSIALFAFGWAYRESGGAALCGISFLTTCFSAFDMAESLNKFRLARMECDYEKRQAIRYINHTPIKL